MHRVADHGPGADVVVDRLDGLLGALLSDEAGLRVKPAGERRAPEAIVVGCLP